VGFAIVALLRSGSYFSIAFLFLLARNCGKVALVDLAEDHIALTAVLLLVAAFAGETLLTEDAEFEEFAVASFENVVVVYGEKIGSGGRHVDLVVVCLR
jgi:S-adenosylmethionine:diacylglycerol 3-amino-3-carboxypropyl transferase